MLIERLDDRLPSRISALAVYLALEAVTEATIAWVPGFPNFGEHQQYLGSAVIIDLLLAYGLYRRSRLAWGASVGLTAFGLLLYAFEALAMLASVELDPKFVAVVLLVAAQLGLLYTRKLRPPPAPAARAVAVRSGDGAAGTG